MFCVSCFLYFEFYTNGTNKQNENVSKLVRYPFFTFNKMAAWGGKPESSDETDDDRLRHRKSLKKLPDIIK